jgi:hypothetical protein
MDAALFLRAERLATGGERFESRQRCRRAMNYVSADLQRCESASMGESFENKSEGCRSAVSQRSHRANSGLRHPDRYPVTPLVLVILNAMFGLFDLGLDKSMQQSPLWAKDAIREEDASVAGFNVGVNIGEAAGQTIFHCHIHLIPRRHGDVENPRGGVRHVIPGKGNY